MNGFIALHSLKEENAKGKNKTTAKIKREAIKHLIRVEKCSPPAYILRGIWVSKKNNADGKKPKRKAESKKILCLQFYFLLVLILAIYTFLHNQFDLFFQSVNTLQKTGDRFLQKNKSMKPFSGLME